MAGKRRPKAPRAPGLTPHKKRRLSKCERLTFRHWVMQGARNH